MFVRVTSTPRFSFRTASTAIAALSAIAVGCARDGTFPVSERRQAELARIAAGQGSPGEGDGGSDLITLDKFSVYATPPAGWELKRNNAGDDRAEHVVWISPTNRTAFGIIFFKMPFPVGHDLAFRYGFLAEADKREGPVNVVEKRWDEQIEGLRFIVDTQKYRVQAKMFVRGSRGWATYAGTRNDMPLEIAERDQAIAARESADFGEELTTPSTRPAR